MLILGFSCIFWDSAVNNQPVIVFDDERVRRVVGLRQHIATVVTVPSFTVLKLNQLYVRVIQILIFVS